MKKAFLFALSLVAAMFTWAQTSPYTGSEAAAGNFYIYNVETGYWLQNNNRVSDWNSQVQVDVQGFDWELIAQEGGTWQLNPKFGNNHSLNSGDANGYMDTGQAVSSWTLTPVEGVSNGYTIESNGTILGVNADKLLVKDGSAGTTWQLVTAEERLAKFVAQAPEVTADAPIDITWMIPGANINIADERFDQLVITYPDNATAKLPTNQGNNPGNCVREIWNNSGAYELGYTLTGLPDGVYRFYVSGFYRDGATGGIGAKVAEGTEEIRAIIYINDKEQPMMSVCQRTASGNGCNVQTGSYFVPDNLADARTACSAGIYANPAIKVNVTDGTIKLGLKAETGVGGDWMVLDYFKLVYYGPDNIESSRAMLQAAIDAAEAWDASNTSTALKTALDEAIATAKGMLTSEDGDEVEAAIVPLNAALNAAKAVDLTVLRATVDKAKAEGIDTSAADDVFANATGGGAVNAVVEALRTARKIKALGGAKDIYTGAEPAADGEYYFFNLGTGMWLSAGSDWNTHAAVDQAGWLFKLNESGEGFTITSSMGSFNNSPYVDTGVNTVYTFQAVAVEGEEKIYNILEGTDLLGYNPDGKTDGKKYWNSVSNVAGADAADANYQWKLVTKAERDALVAAATKAAPVDATYFINNPSLIRKPGYDMWEKEANGGNGGARVSSTTDGNGDRAADYAWEYWNCDNFKFSQKIEGLQPGLYEVSVQGVWREGDGGNQARIVNDGGALNQKAYLLANDVKALLPNIASCPDFVPGVATQASAKGNFPNWPAEVVEFFETGAYKTSVRALVGEDGILTIGVAVDEKATYGDWILFDNFRLTYLGNDETDVAYERAVKAIEAGSAYRIFTEVEGTKYYLSPAGALVAGEDNAGVFPFKKVNVSGTLFETGWNLCHQFTNPSLTGGSSGDIVQKGVINIGDNNRNDWERQVFFLNAEGKYAVRATNANSANWGANTYWATVEDAELPTAGYSLNAAYVWGLEYAYDAEAVAQHETLPEVMNAWVTTIQAAKGMVTDGAQYTSNAKDPSEGSYAALVDGDYTTFFHSTWHTSNDPQADHYLQAELPEAAKDFYFYFKKRSQNNNNRPTTIVVSGSNDGENFTDITTIDEGLPTAATAIDYTSAKIASDEAYKYLRFTVPTTNSGAKTGDHVFFTFSEFYILPSMPEVDAAMALLANGKDVYQQDAANVIAVDQALKAALNTVKVTYALYDADGTEPIQEQTVVQEANSEVNVPAGMTAIAYYDYATEGTVGEENCTIKVTRTYKAGLVLALDNLSNAKAYTIRCDRGALLTKDGYLASTGHNTLKEAEASDFAIISYEDNYYLYSVADGKFVTNNGALAEMPAHGAEDAIQMDAKSVPYFLYYFKINGANNGLNTNGNDPYGYVINTWMTADAGNQYYMIESADFDATEALAALEAYFHPSYYVTYVVKDAAGTTLFTSEEVPTTSGAKITTLPADFQRPYTTYDEVDVTIAEEKTTVEFTATSTFPFEIAASFDEAKWYNMTIRGNYYVAMDETEPYYPTSDKDLEAAESQWAFGGDAYNGIIVYNKAAGEGWTLTKDGDNVVMREGEYSWTIGQNGDGFTLKENGTDFNCINQNGGASGPLQFWNSGNAPTDNGSTFRVFAAPEPPAELALALVVDRYPGMGYSVTEAEVDFAEAIAFLGVEELTDEMLTIVNPDGTEVASTSTDGWFNAEGVATTWGENTAICVKFFQAIPDGAYTICDMNVADEIGKSYTTKWALSANGKKVIYTITVTFVEKPVPAITNLAEVKVADTQNVDLTSELGKCYEALTADVDIASILTTLGVESLKDLSIFAVASDGALDDNYKLGTTDGWRNADGDWQTWGDDAFFYVKADFTRASAQIYEAGGMNGKNTTDEWAAPASYTARYVFVNLKSENLDAVVLNVTLTYIVPDGISGLGADLQNATIYDLGGRKLNKVQKGGIYIVNGKKVTIK